MDLMKYSFSFKKYDKIMILGQNGSKLEVVPLVFLETCHFMYRGQVGQSPGISDISSPSVAS